MDYQQIKNIMFQLSMNDQFKLSAVGVGTTVSRFLSIKQNNLMS